MSEQNNAVETKVEAAAPQPEVDHEALLAQKDAELAKVREERENYKKGLLKAKGKLPEDDYSSDENRSETTEDLIRRVTREEMLATKEAQLQSEKEAVLKAALRRNKELEVALKNRGQVTSNSGAGSNLDKPEGKIDNYFSNEQISALKAKGWSDEKIETLRKNAIKNSQMPKV